MSEGSARRLRGLQIDLGIARQAREAVDPVALERHPMRAQISVLQHETVQSELFCDFERGAIARQGVVESDDRVDLVAPHDAADEPLPVAVVTAIEDPAMTRRLEIFAALANRAQHIAARGLDLLRPTA